jgi:hypothetical protein
MVMSCNAHICLEEIISINHYNQQYHENIMGIVQSIHWLEIVNNNQELYS